MLIQTALFAGVAFEDFKERKVYRILYLLLFFASLITIRTLDQGLYFFIGVLYALMLYSAHIIRPADIFIFGAYCALAPNIAFIVVGAAILLWISMKWRKAPVGSVLFFLFILYRVSLIWR